MPLICCSSTSAGTTRWSGEPESSKGREKVKFSRYEVDLLLHLCLASRAEKEEIIKLLSARLNYLQKSFKASHFEV